MIQKLKYKDQLELEAYIIKKASPGEKNMFQK